GPINNQQLQKMYQVLMSSLAENKRVVVFRFDLNLPQGKDLPIYQNYHLTQFTNSLKSQLQAQHQRKLRSNIRTYQPSLRYAWVQEQKTSQNPHYHFFITLNKDAYHTLGNIDYTNLRVRQGAPHTSLYGMILTAWARALSIPTAETIGLVHVPQSPRYFLNAQNEGYIQQLQAVMQRISYMAKVETKSNVDGSRSFGCSRK